MFAKKYAISQQSLNKREAISPEQKQEQSWSDLKTYLEKNPTKINERKVKKYLAGALGETADEPVDVREQERSRLDNATDLCLEKPRGFKEFMAAGNRISTKRGESVTERAFPFSYLSGAVTLYELAPRVAEKLIANVKAEKQYSEDDSSYDADLSFFVQAGLLEKDLIRFQPESSAEENPVSFSFINELSGRTSEEIYGNTALALQANPETTRDLVERGVKRSDLLVLVAQSENPTKVVATVEKLIADRNYEFSDIFRRYWEDTETTKFMVDHDIAISEFNEWAYLLSDNDPKYVEAGLEYSRNPKEAQEFIRNEFDVNQNLRDINQFVSPEHDPNLREIWSEAEIKNSSLADYVDKIKQSGSGNLATYSTKRRILDSIFAKGYVAPKRVMVARGETRPGQKLEHETREVGLGPSEAVHMSLNEIYPGLAMSGEIGIVCALEAILENRTFMDLPLDVDRRSMRNDMAIGGFSNDPLDRSHEIRPDELGIMLFPKDLMYLPKQKIYERRGVVEFYGWQAQAITMKEHLENLGDQAPKKVFLYEGDLLKDGLNEFRTTFGLEVPDQQTVKTSGPVKRVRHNAMHQYHEGGIGEYFGCH